MRLRSSIALRLTAFLALAVVCLGQSGEYEEDLRSAKSPDGQVEIQLFIGQPQAEGTALLPRMAYRVLYGGKPIVKTSFLGFELRAQNPLGEKPGLTRSESGSSDGFNWVVAHYLQNGSQGRLFDIEARAYNNGVAFRYHIPWSAPMESILLEGENTEFQFGENAVAAAYQKKIGDLPIDAAFELPFAISQPEVGWASILQPGGEDYAPVTLRHDTSSIQGPTMVTSLGRLKDKPWIAVESKPPFTTPWRVIAVAATRDKLSAPMK
jgi:alpha-glucosidase